MKNTFNELQQWLLQNWESAHQLVDSMDAARDQYATVFQPITTAVQKAHPELDDCRTHLTVFNGQVGFGRKQWPREYKTLPSGLWFAAISLDNLLKAESDTPNAHLYVSVPKAKKFDLEDARSKIQKAAASLLKDEGLKYFPREDGYPSVCLTYDLPESRQELIQMLMDKESEQFIRGMASHVLTLSQFIPVLDDIFSKIE